MAVLDGVDYYTLDVPQNAHILRVRVLFTNDTSNGTTLAPAGDETLKMFVTHDGHGMGGAQQIVTDLPNDRFYEYDVSGSLGGEGTYFIVVLAESTEDYASSRTYNLRWEYEPGI